MAWSLEGPWKRGSDIEPEKRVNGLLLNHRPLF